MVKKYILPIETIVYVGMLILLHVENNFRVLTIVIDISGPLHDQDNNSL